MMIEGASVTQGDSLSDLKYWLNFTGIEPNKCQIQKIVIRNVGHRASFVRGLCFTGNIIVSPATKSRESET